MAISFSEGINYKLVAMTSDYLDDHEYDFKIVPRTLENQSMARQQAIVTEKLQEMAAFFPEYLASNKEKMFAEWAESRGENGEEYNPPVARAPQEGALEMTQ